MCSKTAADRDEVALTLDAGGSPLTAIVHPGDPSAARGVVVVVGGPQYRAGSHRQFVLLARHLASAGVPVLRFDYRGIGDSGGPYRGFEDIGDDIAAAISGLLVAAPGVREVVLWGLCDAASAILFYAHRDPRVTGLVLLNPWARTERGEAQAYLRHYYIRRVADPQFWRKVVRGRFAVWDSAKSLLSFATKLFGSPVRSAGYSEAGNASAHAALPDRMADGLARFKGQVLLIMSGRDLTAREFDDAVRGSRRWRGLLAAPRVTRRDLAAADHTFSRRAWRDQVADWTVDWLRSADASRRGDQPAGDVTSSAAE